MLSSQFEFQKEMMMVSWVPKPKKAIILLSTMHSDASIDGTTGDKQKTFDCDLGLPTLRLTFPGHFNA